MLDVPVAFSADLELVKDDARRDGPTSSGRTPSSRADIIEEPEVWGVERWDPDGVVVRLVLKTAPDRQAPVAREMRARIKARFDEEGIEIPLPQRVVWHSRRARAEPPDRRRRRQPDPPPSSSPRVPRPA